MISLIVAHDLNRVIGKDNKMPWHIPNELAYFKEKTMGKAIVMGRNTFESIGRPLPGRLNIVITRNTAYKPDGVTVVHSIEEAIELARKHHEEVMVIGGEQIFKEVLPYTDLMYVTLIQKEFEGDTFFPSCNQEWRIDSESEPITTEDGLTYQYLIYKKENGGQKVV
ncbi:dihydrofolate reductase [Paenisporosarcina quisquiliarum]|uniref:Dihydrofolate reductase n=1 Tax=Paenisporosarcina quisquiliarum TaxID=365346 RepID=A0A9X3LDC0_9BACL|nr:dihydrofolate reductase [Paenisporosarcina quisquiliarum]MCZ8535856.1 dihydrofolate reductase [Paenisporosarcina quisquiliarum]